MGTVVPLDPAIAAILPRLPVMDANTMTPESVRKSLSALPATQSP